MRPERRGRSASIPTPVCIRRGEAGRSGGVLFDFLFTHRKEGRFILDVEHVERDEAAAALSMLRRVVPHAPGAQAVVWDMILRGVHNQIILREPGLVPVVAVHAQENPERGVGRRAGTYTPKTADLESRTVTLPDGQKRVVHLAAHNGAVALKGLTETGEPHYGVLPCVRIQRQRDKAAYRWYGYYRLLPNAVAARSPCASTRTPRTSRGG